MKNDHRAESTDTAQVRVPCLSTWSNFNERGWSEFTAHGHEIPLGAMDEPRDIAHGCVFLASDESKYMTGSELVIDGGFTCH